MGNKKTKKRKFTEASTSQASPKRSKVSRESPPPQHLIKYQDMPLNHRKKFFINDDCGSENKYIEILNWLRTMGSLNGSVFEGIANLNWSEGFPLVEIEVLTPKGNSAKFIIAKNSLYLIAFCADDQWFQFAKCGFQIDTCIVLKDHKGDYTGKPWKHLGPKPMIEAIDFLATHVPDVNGDMSSFISAYEVFFVHLSEAARFYPIQSIVCRSLAPRMDRFDKRTYEDEEMALLDAGGGKNIKHEDDIYSLVKEVGPIDMSLSVPTPDYIEVLLKKYSHLSKVWYVYALTGRNIFEMREADVSKFHVRSRKSLRCAIAVLCNINLEKVLWEWKKKIGSKITAEMYKEMEDQIRHLQKEKKVLLKDTQDDDL